MHLSQPGFTYIACESFTENKERIQKFTRKQEVNEILSKQPR